jgi:hypothetical protein
MNRNVCDWVMNHVPLQEEENPLSLSSETLAHIEECSHCREVVRTKTAVRRLMTTVRMDPISERRLSVRILSGHANPRPLHQPVFSRLSAVVTASLSLLLVLSVVSGLYPKTQQPVRTAEAAVDMRSSAPTLKTNIDQNTVIQVLKAVADNKTVVLSQGASLWMKKGTSVEVLHDTPHLAETRIRSGRVVVDIARHPPGFRFVVQTPSADVEALGTVFSVDISSDGNETIRVAESAVLVRTKSDGEATVVRAGEQLILGLAPTSLADETDLNNDLCVVRGLCRETEETSAEAEPGSDGQIPPPTHTILPNSRATFSQRAADAIDNGRLDEAERILRHSSGEDEDCMRLLFQLAGAYRSRRDYNRAVSVYEHLVSVYSERDAAVNTLVSIGQIKQGFLMDPAGAIYYFDKYLKKRPHGILAEAAGAGKVRALFSLRQWQDVVEASFAYLNAFPTGISREEIIQKKKRAEKQLEENL